MSCKKRGVGIPKQRRTRQSHEDDLPLSLVALLDSAKGRNKKKATSRKTRAPRVTKRAAASVAPPTLSEAINLDDCPESEQMLHKVNEKIGKFMQSGSFMSSDEDESETTKTKINKTPPNQFFQISDDSDDDHKMITRYNNIIEIDDSEPSTSAGTSNDTPKDNKLKQSNDDIMVFIDSVLDSNKNAKKENPLKDMKSLEDFRKETEEMLKNASSLLDEIKTGRNKEPPPNETATSPTVTIGSCPVCLESLAGKLASVTVCGHIFCKECITHTAQTMKKCPTCRKAITLKKVHPIYF